MAHFAKLGADNIVTTVIGVHNNEVLDKNGVEQETKGIEFLNTLYKTNDVWKQTSYNTMGGRHNLGGTPLRKNYAGIGFQYNQELDAFVPPKSFKGWLLNTDTCHWEAPVAKPVTNTQNLTDEAGNPTNDTYYWNEDKINWELYDN